MSHIAILVNLPIPYFGHETVRSPEILAFLATEPMSQAKGKFKGFNGVLLQ